MRLKLGGRGASVASDPFNFLRGGARPPAPPPLFAPLTTIMSINSSISQQKDAVRPIMLGMGSSAGGWPCSTEHSERALIRACPCTGFQFSPVQCPNSLDTSKFYARFARSSKESLYTDQDIAFMWSRMHDKKYYHFSDIY